MLSDKQKAALLKAHSPEVRAKAVATWHSHPENLQKMKKTLLLSKTPEAKEKIRLKLIKAHAEGKFVNLQSRDSIEKRRLKMKGHVPWNKGIKKSDPAGKTLGGGRPVGGIPWNKGKTYEEYSNPLFCTPEVREKQRRSLRAYWSNPDNAEKIRNRNNKLSNSIKQAWKDGKYGEEFHNNQVLSQILSWEKDEKRAEKCLKFRKPNKTEMKLGELLENNFPGEWEYVGDGKVKIGRKIPDWVHSNGQNIVLELFGERWHEPEEEVTIPEYSRRRSNNTRIL